MSRRYDTSYRDNRNMALFVKFNLTRKSRAVYPPVHEVQPITENSCKNIQLLCFLPDMENTCVFRKPRVGYAQWIKFKVTKRKKMSTTPGIPRRSPIQVLTGLYDA